MTTPLTWPLTGGGGYGGSTVLSGQAVQKGQPVDYGTDISTYPDLDDTFAPLTGYLAVAQSIARSLEDRRVGLEIKDWMNEGMTKSDVYALQQAVRTTALSDERVKEVDVTVEFTDSSSLLISIEFILSQGPFKLVLEITQISVELLTIEPA